MLLDELTVVDTGRGFDPEAVEHAGRLGVLELQGRAARRGDLLCIARGGSTGATITLGVPIPG